MYVLGFKRKISKSGSALILSLPKEVRLEPNTWVYLYVDKDRIVAVREPPLDRTSYSSLVRVLYRYKDRQYLGITIPISLARRLNLREGQEVLVVPRDYGFDIISNTSL